MCGRYWTKQCPEMDDIIDEMYRSPLIMKWNETLPITTYGEVCPADVTAVIASNSRGHRAVFPMRWGYKAGKLIINARVETAADKPLFREDWTRHRCIIPASWYFEWEHKTGNDGRVYTLDKYLIQPKGDTMTWLCGLYHIEDGFPYFVILTREPGEDIRFIHNRMPLILPEQYINDWIHPGTKPENLLPYALTDMAFEKVVTPPDEDI